jgi:DNA-binding beta-propeller fold protein YncE
MKPWLKLWAHASILLLLAAGGCSQFNAPARAQNRGESPLQFIGQWGAKGNGPGQLDDPEGMATDRIGNVYIADAGSQFVHKFSFEGTPLLSLQEDSLKEPESIAVDLDGTVYVTDPSRALVFVIFPTEERDRHRALRLKTRPSSENSITVAVDDDGMAYVFDQSTAKVFTFSSRLFLRHAWIASPAGMEAVRKKPSDDLGPLELGGDGNLYLADVSANRLLRFSVDGRFLGSVAPPSGVGDRKISNEFVVSRSYIFMMDANSPTLHVWNLDGSPKLDFDLSEQLGPTHHYPPLLALSPRRELLVLDTTVPHVLRYRINF